MEISQQDRNVARILYSGIIAVFVKRFSNKWIMISYCCHEKAIVGESPGSSIAKTNKSEEMRLFDLITSDY